MKILVVEQDETKSNRLCVICEELKGSCDQAFDLDRGLELATANKYDMILVGHYGAKSATKNMVTNLRLECGVPLIVLSEDNDVASKIELLNSGADSFLTSDFTDEELLAVIKSVLRRYYKDFGVNLYEFKCLQVNFFERSVKINGEDVQIVAKMYDLFEYLIRNKEIILSKNTLFNRVWGFESETTFSVVEVYISKLRKLLEKGELAGQLLTIKNAGYCWTEKDTSANI